MANRLPFNIDDTVKLSATSREAERKHFGLKAEAVTVTKQDYTWLFVGVACSVGFAIGYFLL